MNHESLEGVMVTELSMIRMKISRNKETVPTTPISQCFFFLIQVRKIRKFMKFVDERLNEFPFEVYIAYCDKENSL